MLKSQEWIEWELRKAVKEQLATKPWSSRQNTAGNGTGSSVHGAPAGNHCELGNGSARNSTAGSRGRGFPATAAATAFLGPPPPYLP